MRALLASLAAFLLSGCWLGEDFYAASELREVVPPGVYRADRGPDRRAVTVSIVALRGRLVSAQIKVASDAPEPWAYEVGFIPMARRRELFVVRIRGNGTGPRYRYALLRREPDGSFRLYEPGCVPDEEMARAAGAETSLAGGCTFPSRNSLERGLAAYAGGMERRDHLHFVRVPNG